MLKHKIPRQFAAFLILILLFGCQRQTPLSFFDLSTCAPPCWNGVEMGTTTDGELMDILNRLQFIDQEGIISDSGPWSIFENKIIFQSNDRDFLGYAFLQNGRIVGLEFSGEFSTTFSQLVDQTGEPDYIINNPVRDFFVITAINKQLGVSFSFATIDVPKKYRGELFPDTLVSMITYFDPNIYDQMLEAGLFSQGHMDREVTIKYMHPWDGYGSIEKKYPPASRD